MPNRSTDPNQGRQQGERPACNGSAAAVLALVKDPATREVLADALVSSSATFCATFAEVGQVLTKHSDAVVFFEVDNDPAEALACCHALQSEPRDSGVWIVALTSNIDDVERMLAAGIDDVLLKPISKDTVQARLLVATREILRRRIRTEQERAACYQLSTRAQRQVAVAALGQWALVNVDLDVLIGQAILFVAQMLEMDCCALWELSDTGEELRLSDGAGWVDGHVGSLRMAVQADNAETRAIREGSVIVENWMAETRFRKPMLLEEHQVQSSLAVPVAGARAPVGVLAAHATQVRKFNEDEIYFLQAVAVVLSLAFERHRSEASIQRLAAFPRCNPNPVLELNAEAQLTYANEAAEEMARSFGCKTVLSLLPEDYAVTVRDALATRNRPAQPQVVRAGRTLVWSFFPIPAGGVVHGYAEEITGKLELELQFRQLQKMECVGQLAAGLAHDFNNVLTIIRGHADLLLADENIATKKSSSLNKILGGVERASNLTRQLLTFSRRQIAQTRPVNLNDCIENLLKMLGNVLGENIQVMFEPSRDLPGVLADTGMLDQVVMNLAINARDAMPKGGYLAITTSGVEVDAAHAQHHSEARPGSFVCLSVSDSGFGMDEATLHRIFEPFFTTKGVGRGTGLGLATVYSIVKQHRGWIEVSSRPGQGTTFMIFLPRTDLENVADATTGPTGPLRGGTETILLVEDEASLRELARMILQPQGYEVLEAGSGPQALKVWKRARNQIDLLLTDLLMPDGMTGLELAQMLTRDKPNLKTIYVTGYSGELMGPEGARRKLSFLQKPYSAQVLVKAVRDALDNKATERPGPIEFASEVDPLETDGSVSI